MSTVDYSIGTPTFEEVSPADEAAPADLAALRPLPRISIHAFC